MTQPLPVALVGFGFAGQTFHAPLIDSCAGLELHTVVSSQSDAVAAAYPRARVATLEAALADPAIALVVVATPNDTHAPIAEAALKAGKAVVVDKPFALTVAEGRALAVLAEARGLLLSVFHNRRWDADFLALKQILAEGRLGRIVSVESRFDRFRPEVRDRWRERDEPGAGIWFDLGPHLIDQALQLFGPPLGVTCDLAVQRAGGQAPDSAHAILRYDDLRVVLHMDMMSADPDRRFVVNGDRAAFLKEGLDVQEDQLKAGLRPGSPDWGQDPRPGVLVDGATGARDVWAGPPGDYLAYYDGVAAALRGTAPNPVTAAEALAVMEILEAGERSARSRAEVALAPDADGP